MKTQPVQTPRSALISFLGIAGGVAIAIAVPWVTLAYGTCAQLNTAGTVLLGLVGVAGGVALAVKAIQLSAPMSVSPPTNAVSSATGNVEPTAPLPPRNPKA